MSTARHTPNLVSQPPSPTTQILGKLTLEDSPLSPQAGWDPSRHTKTHDTSLEMKLPGLLTQASSVLCSRPPWPFLSWRLFEYPQTLAVGPVSPPDKTSAEVLNLELAASLKKEHPGEGGCCKPSCPGWGPHCWQPLSSPYQGEQHPISTPAAVPLVPTPPADSSEMGEA